MPCIGLYLQLLWQCVGKDMRNSRFSGCIKLRRYKSGDSPSQLSLYEVSTERAFVVHYVFQGLLMKTVGDLTCNELEVFSMRERT